MTSAQAPRLSFMMTDNGPVDEAVQSYLDGIDPEFRPLFNRIHELVMTAYPDAVVVLSYKIPTYKVGRRKLHVGAWKHGLSLYGWSQDRVGDFTERHPALRTSKGTIQLRPRDAAAISDEELSELVDAALRV
jgi:uncharacterized protein YdhG (YjbR/CyaY superfamily)